MAQLWQFKRKGSEIECLLNGKKVGAITEKSKDKYTWVVYSENGAFVDSSGVASLEDCRENIKIHFDNGIE